MEIIRGFQKGRNNVNGNKVIVYKFNDPDLFI